MAPKLAISPFFILLWIHLLFNILVSGWLIFTGRERDNEAFLYLAVISTIVLVVVLIITAKRSLQDAMQSTPRKVAVYTLLVVHFILSLCCAYFGATPFAWISVIDIALMIAFLTTTITKIYV
ncbi:hypothetical protein EBZ80_12275 [bacterium]|nr:hypothetical protein [bacterium]